MGKSHIKVLLIEDNPGDVRLIWEILSEVRNSPFYLNVADSLLNGLNAITKDKPDVILLDLSLGDSNGIYTLNRVRDKAPDVPIVILTGLDDEMTAMKSLKEGAQDYLVKGRIDSDLLKRALLYGIERNRLKFEIEDKKEKLEMQDRIKYNFILMVFHELLIPASSIKSALSFIDKSRAQSGFKGDMKYSEIIKNNTQKLFTLLDDLINVSEIEAGNFLVKKKDCDITRLMTRDIADTAAFADEKQVRINYAPEGANVFAQADFYRLSQAVTNLLINAVKFSGEKSDIFVSVENRAEAPAGAPAYAVSASPAGGKYALISIKDTGMGISPDVIKSIFNPFFSSEISVPPPQKIIGLGLLIAKNIINAHGGVMWASSEGENKGSVFCILLPQ